jgi:tetratricopeptide (TPR) repeat protein
MTPQSLLQKLETLQTLDPHRELFGASTHGYVLAEPLSLDEVARFEAEHGVRLPDEYRAFLTQMGNGGAGPVYGIKPLAAWRPDAFVQVVSRIKNREGEVVAEAGTGARPALERAADPARPFPLTGAWGPPNEELSNLPADFPAGAHPFDGCTYLAEIGCGYSYFLVITGERAGEVWQDYTAGDGAISPTGKSFFAWYDAWLDAGIAERAVEAMKVALQFRRYQDGALLPHVPLVERAAIEAPRSPLAHLHAGYAKAYQQDAAQAEIHFLRAAELQPSLALDVAVARVALRWSQDQLEEVVALASEALAVDDWDFNNTAQLHEVRVIALRHLRRFAESVSAAEAALELDKDRLQSWFNKSLAHALFGDRDAAERTLRDAIAHFAAEGQEAPPLADGLRALADALGADGHAEDADWFRDRAAAS